MKVGRIVESTELLRKEEIEISLFTRVFNVLILLNVLVLLHFRQGFDSLGPAEDVFSVDFPSFFIKAVVKIFILVHLISFPRLMHFWCLWFGLFEIFLVLEVSVDLG